MTVSFSKACIIGLFVQAVLYGLYVASFVHCFRWLLIPDDGWKLRRRNKWSMPVVVSIFIFMAQTTDIAISAVITIAAISGRAAVFNKLGIVNVRASAVS